MDWSYWEKIYIMVTFGEKGWLMDDPPPLPLFLRSQSSISLNLIMCTNWLPLESKSLKFHFVYKLIISDADLQNIVVILWHMLPQ